MGLLREAKQKIAGSDPSREPRRGEAQGRAEQKSAGSGFSREPRRGEAQGRAEQNPPRVGPHANPEGGGAGRRREAPNNTWLALCFMFEGTSPIGLAVTHWAAKL